ncbi:hypothetical protein Y032_0030g2018 [Ancylostoma ceylanicum]|uniref:Uncharacterized protein n=1 Tax=Ancylostoma ceylanicum TaxID=53326 RepID=A0A016UPQ3_9BILA|nr:hypothetical protein Y032_0030g2018 [Ancylostoma ceylanicum]
MRARAGVGEIDGISTERSRIVTEFYQYICTNRPSSLVGRLTLESQFALHGLSGASPVTCVREGSPKAPVIFDVASLTSGYHFI